jgi:salicylate hydroxylase
MRQLLVVGGGIGGLAAALAAARAGWQSRVLEQAPVFSEVGAGLQMGPNVTRRLRHWGLIAAAQSLACRPDALVARDAGTGDELARLPLGDAFEARYGAPYLTIARADLHGVLLQSLRGAEVSLEAGRRVTGWVAGEGDSAPGVAVHLDSSAQPGPAGDALVGADGLWSALRQSLLGDGLPNPSNHVAYRGLVPLDGRVPGGAHLAREVTAWLGPRLHAVSYPVRGGRALNVVCVVEQAIDGQPQGWDQPGTSARLMAATGPVGGPLRELLQAVPAWGLWVLHDRPPVAGPQQMARGCVALLGDAAHPMRPYLAQGAAMALEDADELGRSLALVNSRNADLPQALQCYAQARWERVARVQRRSLRNGAIFHASGALRLGRDWALRSLGARIMDLPWLYGG